MNINGNITIVEDEPIHTFMADGRIVIQVPRALIDYIDIVCLDCGLSGVVGPDVKIPIKKVLSQEIKQAKEQAYGRNARTTKG